MLVINMVNVIDLFMFLYVWLLFLLFVGLKLSGEISWSWVWIFSPIWVPVFLSVILLTTSYVFQLSTMIKR